MEKDSSIHVIRDNDPDDKRKDLETGHRSDLRSPSQTTAQRVEHQKMAESLISE